MCREYYLFNKHVQGVLGIKIELARRTRILTGPPGLRQLAFPQHATVRSVTTTVVTGKVSFLYSALSLWLLFSVVAVLQNG